MSRRKQLKPKHLDAEDDIIPEVGNNSKMELEENVEWHVCRDCNIRFSDLGSYVDHRISCSKSSSSIDDVMAEQNDERHPRLGLGGFIPSSAGEERHHYAGHREDLYRRQKSEDVPIILPITRATIDEDYDEDFSAAAAAAAAAAAVIFNGRNVSRDDYNLDSRIDLEDTGRRMEKEEEREVEGEEEGDDSLGKELNDTDEDAEEQEEEEEEDRMMMMMMGNTKEQTPHPVTMGSIPIGLMAFGGGGGGGDSNVKLASIGSTDVAVAQFAENNILPSDFAMLNMVLWNLQQQQLFQMHLLQQLQQQLVYATATANPVPQTRPSSPHSPATPVAVVGPGPPTSTKLSPPTVSKGVTVSLQDNLESRSTATGGNLLLRGGGSGSGGGGGSGSGLAEVDSTATLQNTTILGNEKLENYCLQGSLDVLRPISPSPIPPMLAMMDMSSSKLLQEKILQDGKATKTGGSSLSSQNRSRPTEDPFFKHRCRYCQKGFSSDSALQIHIRSHTGERPYRCSICGNRFSTKGNLKVHFMCHTEKYPHIRMDQNLKLDRHRHPSDVSIGTVLPPPPTSLAAVAISRDQFNSHPPMLVPIKRGMSPVGNPDFMSSKVPCMPASVHLQASLSHDAGERLKFSPHIIQSQKEHARPPPTVVPPPPSNWLESSDSQLRRSTPVSTSSCEVTPERSSEDLRLSSNGHDIAAAESDSQRSKMNSVPMDTTSINNSSSGSLAPPPPLSLLSSMSTSLSAFPSPPFSSSFSNHRTPIPPNLTSPSVHLPPFGFDSTPVYFRNSSLHGKREDPLEQFMEVQKSETSKMEQLVRNIDKKLTDPNQCAICYRTLSCKSALQMHYRTHTGERPFRCKICGRAFTTKGNLKTHMGVHRAKPPVRMMHQCPVCHKQFTNALVLQQHIRMHTGELPKQMPFPGNMMIIPSTMNYMPFPGYPFFPSRFHPIQRPALVPLPPPNHPPLHPTLHQPVDMNRRPHYLDAIDCKDSAKNEYQREKHDEEHGHSHISKSAFSIDALKGSSRSTMEDGDSSGDDRRSQNGDMGCGPEEQNEIDIDNNRAEESMSEDEDEDDKDVVELRRDSNDDDTHRQGTTPSQNSTHNVTLAVSGADDEEDEIRVDRCDVSPQRPDSSKEHSLIQPQIRNTSQEMTSNNANRYLMFDYPHNAYSASLLALEEKVKEINVQENVRSTGISHPLEQMERIIRRTEILHPNHPWQSHVVSQNNSDRKDHANDFGKHTEERRAPSSNSKSPGGISGNIINTNSEHANNLGFVLSSAAGDLPCESLENLDLSPSSFEATTGKPNTTCSICYKTFACKSALDIHYRSHTKERPFKCKLCDRAFSTKGNMKQHMMTHKANNGDLSGQSLFSSEGSSSSRSHSCPPDEGGPNSIARPSLNGSFRASSENSESNDGDGDGDGDMVSNPEEVMQNDSEITPDEQKPNPSSVGEDSGLRGGESQSPNLSRKSNLRHLCQVCQKPFSSASALQIHMRTHTGDKPFKCTVCNKAFTTKGNLKVHMGTHMWNNGPSRRGRRMSVEGIAGLAPPPKCSEFFGVGHRLPPPHDLYPFPFPPFSNSFVGSKLNEISVIQSLSNRIPHLSPVANSANMMSARLPPLMKPHPYSLHPPPPPPLPPSHRHPLENLMKCRLESSLTSENNNRLENSCNRQCGNNGELDLSLKKSMLSVHAPSNEKLPSPPWAWKTSCNRCSKVCSSPGALELHMKTHSTDWLHENNSPKPLMT